MNKMFLGSRVISLLLIFVMVITGVNWPAPVYAMDNNSVSDNDILVDDEDDIHMNGATTYGVTGSKVYNPTKSSHTTLNVTGTTINYIKVSGTAADGTTSYSYGYNGTATSSTDSKYYRDFVLDTYWTTIAKGAFSGNTSYIGSGNDKSASKNKYLLRSFVTESGCPLSIIGDYAFYDCLYLRHVDLRTAGSLSTIGDYAFYTDTNLNWVLLPDNITSIGTHTFRANQSIYCTRNSATEKALLNAGYTYLYYTSSSVSIVNATVMGSAPSVGGITRRTFLVTTSAGKGGSITSTQSVYPQGSCTIVATPSSGYSMGSLIVDGSNKGAITSTTFSQVRADHTVTASFTANTYTIKWDARGGTSTLTSSTATYGQPLGTVPSASYPGWEFIGWFTAATGGSQVTGTTTCTGAATYYAHWKPLSYTVTFNANGGTCSPTTKTVTSGQTYGELPKATRDGYNFLGWFTAPDDGIEITEKSTIETQYTILYAHWQKQGGSVDPVPGPDPLPPVPDPSKTHKVSVAYITAFGEVKMDDSVKLSGNIETIKKDGIVGGDGKLTTYIKDIYEIAEGTEIVLKTMTKDDRKTVVYVDGKKIKDYKEATNKIVIGSLGKKDVSIEIHFPSTKDNGWHMYDDPVPPSEDGPVITPYDPNDPDNPNPENAGGFIITYPDGSKAIVDFLNNLIKFISKDGEEKTIKFNLKDINEYFSELVKIGDDGKIIILDPTKNNYVFIYWINQNDDKTNVSDISDLPDGTELTPAFEEDMDPIEPVDSSEYGITYILNDAQLTVKQQSKLYSSYENVAVKLPKNVKKSGYVFLGWYIGDIRIDKISRNNALCVGNIKVEAKFAKKSVKNGANAIPSGSCRVTYKLNGGSVNEKGQEQLLSSYANGVTIKLPVPKKNGYKFVGWIVNGTKVKKLSYKYDVCNGKDITVEAMWTPKSYTIQFMKNGGKGKMKKFTTYTDYDTVLPECTFNSGSLVFKNWNTKKDGSGFNYNNKATVKNLTQKKNVKLYAFYTATQNTNNIINTANLEVNTLSENGLD